MTYKFKLKEVVYYREIKKNVTVIDRKIVNKVNKYKVTGSLEYSFMTFFWFNEADFEPRHD